MRGLRERTRYAAWGVAWPVAPHGTAWHVGAPHDSMTCLGGVVCGLGIRSSLHSFDQVLIFFIRSDLHHTRLLRVSETHGIRLGSLGFGVPEHV